MSSFVEPIDRYGLMLARLSILLADGSAFLVGCGLVLTAQPEVEVSSVTPQRTDADQVWDEQ